MAGSSENSSYEYKANVKDKVKKLESSMLNPEEEVFEKRRSSLTAGFRWRKDHRDSLTLQKSKDIVKTVERANENEKPAVIEVETTQLNSTAIIDEKFNSSLNNNNVDVGQLEGEENKAVHVSVKGLLKKFSHGVVSVSQPFRRKSLLPNSDTSSDAAVKSSSKIAGRSFDSIESTDQSTSLEKPDKNLNQASKNGILTKKTKDVAKPDAQFAQNIPLTSESSSKIISAKDLVQDDQPTLAKGNQKLQSKSDDVKEKQLPVNSVAPLTQEQLPKPKPRIRIVPPNSTDIKENNFNPKNFATILVMGPGRAGKSSMVNSLLRQDLLAIHKQRPSTREILELTASVKIESSTDLSIIKMLDVPGFENKDEDASTFSTLISYLDNKKEGFRGKSPTLVIVTIGFDTWKNPFQSEDLVNFLKVISHYQKNFFDSTSSNFIFMVTYSTQTTNTENVKDAKLELSKIIRQHTSIMEPVIAFQGRTINADVSDDNKTNNLIRSIRSVFKAKDFELASVGQLILNATFGDNYPNSIQQSLISKRIPLQNFEHPEVIRTQKALQYIYLNIEPQEISTLLEIGWENVDSKFRQTSPSSLRALQKLFQKYQIRTFSELPEEPLKILSILRQIPHHNLAATDLLMETLQLRIPSCYPALIIGQGYDVSRDSVMHVSPFQFSGRLITSPVGLIPEEIDCKVTNDREIIFRFFYSTEEYVLDRMKDLSIKYVTFPTSSLPVTTDQKLGYNIVKPNQEPTKTTTAKALIEYRTFQLSLCGGEDNLMSFKPQFWDTLSSLPDLDMKKQETIDCWKEFFNYWGTHVIKSAFGGGSVQVNFRGKMLSNIFKSLKQDSGLPSDEYETSKVFQWITGDGLDFITTTDDSKAEFLQGFDVDTSFLGGDMKFQQMDLTKIAHLKVAEVREEWIRSLPLNPVILETNLTLIPLSYFVRVKSEGIATKMDVAFHYFYANFMASQEKQSSCSIL